MGTIRNGARSVLNILAKACKLSHLPGFRPALNGILGVDVTNDFYVVWTPLCNFVETLIAADNWFNQIDYLQEVAGTEDINPV